MHLVRCEVTRPTWEHIFDYLDSIGVPRPACRTEAIIFGLWTLTKLGPAEARALLRLTYGEIYRRFANVDLRGDEFDPLGAAIDSLRQFKRAVVRRAVNFQRWHAQTAFSHKACKLPAKEAQKYPKLLSMTTTGIYGLQPQLPAAIANLQTIHAALTKSKAEAAQRLRERQRAKKRGNSDARHDVMRRRPRHAPAARPGGGRA